MYTLPPSSSINGNMGAPQISHSTELLSAVWQWGHDILTMASLAMGNSLSTL